MNRNETKPTTEQARAYVMTVKAIADTIKEMGSAREGTLYAALVGRLNLVTFNGIIELLVSGGLVRREPSHLLVWIGR